MGQYWLAVNLDKKEFVDPHKLGSGLKLWEQLANSPGVGAALIILTAAMPERRGGGDLDNTSIAGKNAIGRWAGNRIAIVGDYAEPNDIDGIDASIIYDLCRNPDEEDLPDDCEISDLYTDVSDDVCKVIEESLDGEFSGTGWRSFKYNS